MSGLSELARGMGDVVFPPTCVHCRDLVEGGSFRHICVTCEKQINWVNPPHCATCGHPFYGEIGASDRLCEHCVGLEPAYRAGCTAVLFKGPVRSLVIELKYHRGRHVLEDMTEIFRRAPHVLDHVRDGVLVPVPLHPRKARERGFNQSELVAEMLVRAAGGATRVEHLLKRTTDTQTQTAFDRRTRQENLKNAFALARGASLIAGQHIILVDDVFTTGSTLNSCARTLRCAGALNLDVVTFAHG